MAVDIRCTLRCDFIVCSSDINALEQPAALAEQKSRDKDARCSEMLVFIYKTTRDHNIEDRVLIIKLSITDYTLQALNKSEIRF